MIYNNDWICSMLELLKKKIKRKIIWIEEGLMVDFFLDDSDETPLPLRWCYLIEALVRKRERDELIKFDPTVNLNAYIRASHRWQLYSMLLTKTLDFIRFLEKCITWLKNRISDLRLAIFPGNERGNSR